VVTLIKEFIPFIFERKNMNGFKFSDHSFIVEIRSWKELKTIIPSPIHTVKIDVYYCKLKPFLLTYLNVNILI